MGRQLPQHRRRFVHPGPLTRTQKTRLQEKKKAFKEKLKHKFAKPMMNKGCELQFPGKMTTGFDPAKVHKLYGHQYSKFGVYDEVREQNKR